MSEKIKRALVIGTGMMGPGIALTLARGGLDVKLGSCTLAGVDLGIIQIPEGHPLFPYMTVLKNLELSSYIP